MLKNELNKRYDRLVVLKFLGNKHRKALWLCRCDCGQEKEIYGYNLRTGQSKSCGCYQKEVASKLNRKPLGEAAFQQLFNHYKNNARRRAISFGLTKEQFRKLTKENCFYCGEGPNQIITGKTYNGSYIYNGIDRFNNKQGYTIENCVSCCKVCNLMKLDKSVEEFLTACRRVVKNLRSSRVKYKTGN